MPKPVIVSAVRTAIARSFKGSLVNVASETLATEIIVEAVRRSGIAPSEVDDVILAELNYGGGDLARHAAVAAGWHSVPGQAVNRHCAGSLTSIANASAHIASGMERVIVAGGVQSLSTAPLMKWRVPGSDPMEFVEPWMPPSHPETPDAPTIDMAITVGWNTAKKVGISREAMDEWALRSHQRAVAAIDAGKFVDEILPLKVAAADGSVVDFAVDEHPRRDSSLERMAALPVLHPEIEGFSITAGNSSGINDAASAVALTADDYAIANGLETLATVRSWASTAVTPADNGIAAVNVIGKILDRTGLKVEDVALWEINEAFASVPIAAVRAHGIDEEKVNFSGSGCSLGHPISASGARQITTLVYELRRRGGGIGVSAMCAGGGQGGALVIEV
ncbi:thiolase family protein [Nocardia bovistercoris]|uniref:Probable acetyl-CoA acetyltransferase n=1 Tax=Nocardia bovistercoris TaxID=2785916 RepID=A0A931IBG0_9NOCA|nr:thiolase family protein [Nocardia bovistercoris]MBH0777971.1 thiolase family protein [Nocardia bovistercoris]